MRWMSEQSIYKRERKLFENSYSGQRFLIEEYDEFLNHISELRKLVRRIAEAVRYGTVTENQPLIMFFYEDTSPIRRLTSLVVVLRDDGFVYFGKREGTALLGLGGRTKNGLIEFYDQYKDQIDAYVTKGMNL